MSFSDQSRQILFDKLCAICAMIKSDLRANTIITETRAVIKEFAVAQQELIDFKHAQECVPQTPSQAGDESDDC